MIGLLCLRDGEASDPVGRLVLLLSRRRSRLALAAGERRPWLSLDETVVSFRNCRVCQLLRGDDGHHPVGVGVEGGLPARVTSFFMLIFVGSGFAGFDSLWVDISIYWCGILSLLLRSLNAGCGRDGGDQMWMYQAIFYVFRRVVPLST